eukprot:TRINITY_DN7953_c0_g1_i4.p1 TRINITY_DN7953_c0_g1~~TRINITY_DN7953_c0_g1_i4.p1  ORF type:complete len:1264 (+),score=154.07 TRINITY_DN7953_c0_g1_i4:321-4112(+)
MEVQVKGKVNILQWNCRSIKRNLPYLINYLSKNKLDILCMQSLGCASGDLPKIGGYYYPPVHGLFPSRGKVGTATYIKIGLKYESVLFELSDGSNTAACCTIRVQCIHKAIHISNIYYPQADKEGLWAEGFASREWLVVGDFNVHSRLWDRGCLGPEDDMARDNILASNLVLLNDGSATRLPDRANDRPTAIDLSLATPDLACDGEWTVGDDPLSSDHLPITITLRMGARVEPHAHTPNFNYDRADWDLFRARLDTSPIPDQEGLSVTGLYTALQTNILVAAEQAIPISKPGRPGTRNSPWWTAECDRAVRAKRRACGHYKANANVDTHANMKIKKEASNKTVAEAQLAHWTSYISDVGGHTNLGEVFAKIKKMKQQYVLPDPDLHHGERVLTTSADKAEAFVDAFAAVSSTEHLPEGVRQTRRAREDSGQLPDPEADNATALNQPITRAELKRALSSVTRVKVAEGADRVSYRMLRELPDSYVEGLLTLFRRCWEEGVIPEGWKHAIVTPIHKRGKPRREVGSYRPISLTSHISKIYERIIKYRLNYYCEKNNIIPRCQAGFRRGRGVTDHLVRLGSHMRKAMARRKAMFAVFFDVHRAFDTVWHRRLLEKLKSLGLSGRINIVLDNRTIQVRWRGSLSTSRGLEMGVPQGSVIAPLLFSLMFHDIDKIKVGNSVITLFADDLAVWQDTKLRRLSNVSKQNSWFHKARNGFQYQVDKVVQYMDDCGFSLSPTKTQFTVFGRHGRVPEAYHINIYNKTIYFQHKCTYLGAVFTSNGSSIHHTKLNRSRAARAANLIKMLSRVPWANKPKTMVVLVGSLVRSRLTYGLEAFWDIPPTTLKAMEAVECRALKISLGLPRATPNALVYREAGLLPLEYQVRLMCAKYIFRAQTVPNSIGPELTGTLRGLARKREVLSIHDSCQDLLRAAGVEGVKVATRPLHPYPPWLTEGPRVELDMAGLKKSDNPLYVQTVAREYINSRFSNTLCIYTDGSLGERGAGAAFCIPALGDIAQRYHLPNLNIFTIELVAILMALNFVANLNSVPLSVTVLSDSQSALTAIQSDDTSSREDVVREVVTVAHQLRVRGCDVLLQWVPAHVNIAGNEAADKNAKLAAAGERAAPVDMALSMSDIRQKLVKAVWGLWGREFSARADGLGAIDLTAPVRAGVFPPSVPTYLARIIYRLRAGVWKTIFIPKPCKCGAFISPHHVIFDCPEFKDHFKPLIDKLNSKGLPACLKSVCVPGGDMGWGLAVEAASLIYSCEAGVHL